MWKKIIEVGPEAQRKFIKGIETVDKVVGGTLGPAGRNRIVQQKYKAPWVINDGAEIARRIVLDDPIEDLAAQVLVEVALKTAEQAGDGTTTSVVIGAALARKCYSLLGEEAKKSVLEGGTKTNPMQLWRQIQTDRSKAVELLKKASKKVEDEDLERIVSTSLENLEYGKTLADLIRTIGIDGYISVEDNWATKYGITTEVTAGMKFLGKYASPYLATSSNQKEAVWEDAYILVCNQKLEAVSALASLIKEFHTKGIRKLVIINGFSEGVNPYSPQFIEQVARAMYALTDARVIQKDNIIQILAVKAPSLTSDELGDVATFCNAVFLDKALGRDLTTASVSDLGFAKKVSVTEDEVNIIGGTGDTKTRIEILKEQVELEKDQMFKEKLKRRIAALSSGVGIIRVGAQTESERSYLKEKLKDAVSSAKVALQEGYVKGGGLSFKEVAEELKDSILYEALNAPYERICENAGEKLDIPDSIINPLKVDRLALENACSGVGMLITSDGAIAEKRLEYHDYLEKALKKAMPIDDRSDWRDEEQRDLGAPSVIN